MRTAISCTCLASASWAIDYQAFIRVWAGPTETNGTSQQQLDERYNFQLWQQVSPWLRLFGSYRYTSFRSSFEEGLDFDRSISQPGLGFLYDRPTFVARVQAFDRELRSSIASQNLDVRSYLADLEWRPSWGPQFLLRAQDDTNTADPAVFGLDTESQRLSFSLFESRYRTWSARYTYDFTDTLNNLTRFNLRDDAHVLRVTYGDGWLQNRLNLAADTRVRYVTRNLEQGSGIPLDQPVPLQSGLFAVDTSPAVVELQAAPSLIDGDRETPASPPINIGGSNTFRNIGFDLGLTRPITQIEMSVDRPSGPGLVWEVWQSPDNLNWFRVPGAQSIWDGALLRYLISIPETQNRFFKAVNLSPNTAPLVLVTEIRALVESGFSGESSASGTDGWFDLRTSIRPMERIELTLFGLGRRDIGLVSGASNRSQDTLDYGGQVRIGLARTLELRFAYRVTDLEEDQTPVLENQQERASASLEWTPLSTVNVQATAASWDETAGDQPIRSTDTLTLRAATDLFPRLTLTNQWLLSEIEDSFSGFLQETRQWTLGFDGRPTGNWTLGGALSYANYDSTGVIALTDRTMVQLQTTWLVFRYLSLNGDWNYTIDNLQDTLSQRYSASWNPGRRLALTLSFSQIESGEFSSTSNNNGTLTYRLNRWLTTWFTVNNSRTAITSLPDSETTSYRFGVNLNI